MNSKPILQTIIASLALGVGLIGVNAPAMAHPDDSSYSNYHQRSFRDVQPFRSLNVTPRYHIPLPRSNRYYDDDSRYYPRQRRVYRRGYRKPINYRSDLGEGSALRDRDYYPNDTYIRIRVK